jgi:hypothetical protein
MLIKKKVRELKDADVRRISLVKRGANRIPIKIQKADRTGEQEMGINLGSLVFRQKSDTPASVSAIVFPSKPENYDQIKSLVEKAGFATDKPVEEKDGTFVFAQTENYDQDSTVIRMSDDLVVVMKSFQPYAYDMDSFNEIMQAQGFYNGVDAACCALRQTLIAKMDDAKSPADAATATQAVVADFGQYLVSLAKGLPSNAFKFEKAYGEAVKTFKAEKVAKGEKPAVETEVKVEKGDKAPEGVDQAKWDEMSADERTTWMDKNKAKKTETPAAEAPKVDAPAAVDKAPVEKSETAIFMDSLSEQLVRLNQTMENLATVQKSQGELIQTAVSKSEDLEKRLKGTVIASAPRGDDPSGSTTVRKSESGPFANGSFDTALSGFRRK